MGVVRIDPRKRAEAVIRRMRLGDVLQRLALLSPLDLKALEILAKDTLLRRWPTRTRKKSG